MKEDIYKNIRPTEDEFTEEMHKDFVIDKETEIKHKVWHVVEDIEIFGYNFESRLVRYGITKDDYERHKDSYPDKTRFPKK